MSEERAAQHAVSIAALAKDERFTPRAGELEALAGDLSRPEGDTWAGMDLFAAFPPDSTIELKHRNIGERIAGIVAAVSVFLPVGWTWREFRGASAAYEQMISDQGEPEGRTFLGLWATGFDGRLGAHDHLAPMATVSLALIAFAIFWIVVHRVVAGNNVRREEREIQAARSELVRHLAGAQLVLNARRADHPLRIEGIVKSSMDKLRKTQEAARKAAVELSTTAENVNTGVSELLASVHSARAETEALLVQAQATNASLETATTRAGEAVSSSVASLDSVVRTGVEVTQAAVSSSLSALDASVKEGIHASRDSVRESAQQLSEQFEGTRAAVSSSLSALDASVKEGIHASRDSVRESAQQLSEQLARAMQQFERSLGSHLQGLTTDAVAAIGESGTALMGVVDRLGSSTEVSAGAAGSLAEQVAVMRDDNALARDELRVALEGVRSTLESIEIALSRHESTLQGHASELTGTRDAAERMLRQLTSSLVSVNGNGGLHSDMRA